MTPAHSVDVMLDGRVLVGSSDMVFVVHPNGIVDNFTVQNGGLQVTILDR